MKNNTDLIKNPDHDKEDENRDPLDGRKTIGCLFGGVLILGAFLYILSEIIKSIR